MIGISSNAGDFLVQPRGGGDPASDEGAARRIERLSSLIDREFGEEEAPTYCGPTRQATAALRSVRADNVPQGLAARAATTRQQMVFSRIDCHLKLDRYRLKISGRDCQ
jgi:hypothetical protein